MEGATESYTFERGFLGQVESSSSITDSILGEAAMRSHHLMKSGNTVSRFEFDDIRPDGMDDTSNVIARVHRAA